MKKIFCFALAALATLVSCQKIETPAPYAYYTNDDMKALGGTKITIAELAKQYNAHVASLPSADQTVNSKRALTITKEEYIEGVVFTTDQPGNLYKSLYIQDNTGGIEVKIGKNSLYNDYLPGQTVFIACNGLTVGMYGYKTGNYGGNGTISIGYVDPAGEYENSYIENTLLVDSHIFRGNPKALKELKPTPISDPSTLPNPSSDSQATSSKIATYVTLQGLKYANESFVLLYLDSTKDKKSGTNRVFLSDTNGIGKFGKGHGITSWAMSKNLMRDHVVAGDWDDAEVASGSEYLKDEDGNKVTIGHKMIKGEPDAQGRYSYPGIEKAAYSVSQYFTMGSVEIQIRTSGFSKFCDLKIPDDVLQSGRAIDVTGLITLYQGSLQFTVNSADDFVYSDTKEKIYK